MENNKSFILAIALSLAVLIGWQLLYMRPAAERARQQAIEAQRAAQQAEKAAPQQTVIPGSQAGPAGETAPSVSAFPSAVKFETREAAVAASPRVKLETPSLAGSINLKGGRIDDVVLRDYTVTVNPNSEKVVLLSPSGSPVPYYAFTGWLPDQPGVVTPTSDTVWQQEGSGTLTPSTPVVLRFDNGAGLIFRRTISVDDHYMFTISDEVENHGEKPVALRPYGQVARLTEPTTSGYSVLFEGLISSLGKGGIKEFTYSNAVKNYVPNPDPFKRRQGGAKETFTDTGGWAGFTDQYWATVLIPQKTSENSIQLFGNEDKEFFANQIEKPVTVEPGAKTRVETQVFAGAKEVNVLNGYEKQLDIANFSNLIDWGWFPFLTRPMFALLDFFYKLFGNFGLAILTATVLVKLVFFPLAHKSYSSMSKMKALQPEMKRIQERFKDDRARQQQALMELYKKEKVNPMAGCLPIFIQIPVFFSLYKVLLITIEMRHAPFFGWIQDLSAPDPTSIFNLFGLIPWAPPPFLMLGVLPLCMGFSMFVQMKLNPTPPDPIQQQVFNYMPVVFTFMLAHFPAGLVLYWTWNNILSFTQQAVIMKRQGTQIDIMQNLGFKKVQKRVQNLTTRSKNDNGRSRTPAE
jgi:YidC/Oxa1 family membrane protein insertase